MHSEYDTADVLEIENNEEHAASVPYVPRAVATIQHPGSYQLLSNQLCWVWLCVSPHLMPKLAPTALPFPSVPQAHSVPTQAEGSRNHRRALLVTL